MKDSERLKQALIDLMPTSTAFITAEVKSVDETKMICVCVDALGNERISVRLRANIDQPNGFVLLPKVGSSVVLGVIDSKQFFVAMTSDVDKVLLDTDRVVIDQDTIVFDQGKNGGLTITPELVKQLTKSSARVDGIIDAINNAVAIPQDGGVGLQNTMKAKLATLIDVEDFSQIENDKVKH